LYNDQLKRELPAMVAAIVSADGDMMALHRTWLIKRGPTDDTWDRLREDDTARYGATADGKPLAGKKVMGSMARLHHPPMVRQARHRQH
jgi:hypothetical protein